MTDDRVVVILASEAHVERLAGQAGSFELRSLDRVDALSDIEGRAIVFCAVGPLATSPTARAVGEALAAGAERSKRIAIRDFDVSQLVSAANSQPWVYRVPPPVLLLKRIGPDLWNIASPLSRADLVNLVAAIAAIPSHTDQKEFKCLI